MIIVTNEMCSPRHLVRGQAPQIAVHGRCNGEWVTITLDGTVKDLADAVSDFTGERHEG